LGRDPGTLAENFHTFRQYAQLNAEKKFKRGHDHFFPVSYNILIRPTAILLSIDNRANCKSVINNPRQKSNHLPVRRYLAYVDERGSLNKKRMKHNSSPIQHL
jgi:hypothetical protein